MSRRFVLSQSDLPFLDALQGYYARKIVPFHTPGHKQGRGAHDALIGAFRDAVRLDVSDVVADPRFNDSWAEALRAAERLAASAFGAKRTYFVVNGTSGAIHAMLLAARMLGYEEAVLPRESHVSVFAGLALAGLRPCYVPSRRAPNWQLTLPPDAAAYGVYAGKPALYLVTRPTYYGIAQSLEPLADLAHARGGLLGVDEAHGPHLRFHDRLPPPALSVGADLVAQSTHKVLGALTQSSMLHLGTAVPEGVIEQALYMTQSTSPSGLLLASLDAARAQMATQGSSLWERAIELAERLRFQIERLGLAVLSEDELPVGYLLDPTRLVVRTADRGFHGVEAAKLLRERGVQVEMADPWHIVVLITWADTPETIGALVSALRYVLHNAVPQMALPAESIWSLPAPEPCMTPREALLSATELVPVSRAEGRVAAEMVCPYPPGIPLLCPGEKVDAMTVAYFERIRDAAFEVRGASDPSLKLLRVVKE